MKAKIQDWESKINEATGLFKSKFGGLTANELNWKPNAETWSIAQNIHHLMTTNEEYYKVIDSVRNGDINLPFTARFGFFTNFVGNMLYNALEPSRRIKVKTFSVFEPTKGSDLDDDIIKKFIQHQTNFITFIKSCEDLLIKNQVICSPVNRQIVYTLEKAFDIITIHEFRHYNQASELMEMRNFGN
ncbi:MAG: DinB family protein [Saprospiraceae bacterium]